MVPMILLRYIDIGYADMPCCRAIYDAACYDGGDADKYIFDYGYS